MKVIVIGGGPAGLVSAISAATENNEVIVLEKIHPFIQNKLQNITKGNTNKLEHIICLSLIFILFIDVIFSAMGYL